MKTITTLILMVTLTACGVTKETKKQTPSHKVEWVEIVMDTNTIDSNYFYRSHQ
jgi:hypothetical protein